MVLAQQLGDFDGARALMRDLRARAELELGSNHGYVSYARGGSNPSPNVIALEALVALKLGDEAALDEDLALLEDASRSSADAVLIGALVQYERGGIAALASFAERVDVAGLGSVELYQMLGT
jgi:hypothetical protein